MIVFFPIALLLITTGNARSESVVNTKVEGASATVETRIYTNVNGNESTVTRDKPGAIRVVNDGTTVTVSTPSVSPVSSSPASDSGIARSWFLMLKAWLADFMKQIK